MAVNAIKEKLGGISKYRFNRKINTSGFSPEQQKMIVDHLGRSGKSNGLAPEGYLSVRGFTEKYNISSDIIFRVVKAIKDQLGDVNIYMFGTKNTLGYSPEQQEIIMDYVKNHPKKTWKNHSN